MKRRHFALSLPTLAAAAHLPALAQSGKTSIVLGMALEPVPGLDPTAGAAAAIAVELDCAPRAIPTDTLRQALARQGANIG